MNIALFFTYDVSLDDWGNQKIIEREIELYKQISKKYDIKFKFFTFGNETDLNYQKDLSPIEIVPIYQSTKKFQSKGLNFLNSLLIPFKFKKELSEIDILKTNQLMGSWIPILIKIIYGKKLIVRTGYNILEFSIKERRGKLKNLTYYLLTQISLLFCNKFVVTSKADKDYMSKHFLLRKDKLVIISNWIIETKPRQNNKRYENRLLAVGRLEKQKNYQSMLKFIMGTEFTLDIVGKGSLKKELSDFALKNDISVNFMGQINFSELQELYWDYKYYLMFSDYEGHPKSLIEAMSSGCIPIVKLSRNIEDVVSDSNGIIVNKENINTLLTTKKIDSQKLKILSKNALDFSVTNYSIKRILKSEVDLYNSLVKSN